ncbi:MAG: 6-bladed beta-propeller, partial [Gemmatimonadetes bacterium]|nr:6-bladed beta-propeller [Gemmatimonadota bacterium]
MFINRRLLAPLLFAIAPAAAQEVVELPAEDRWLGVEFAEVFSLGSLDAAEWQHFGMLQAAAFDAAGNLYLLDVDARTIVVVDSTGGFVRTIGQSGNGPGEFDFPRDLAILPDGRVVVSDIPRHRTFQIFNSDGSFDRGVRVGNDILAVAGRIDADRGSGSGVFVAAGDLVRYLPMRREEHEDPPGKRSVLRLSLGGDELAQEVVAHGWAPPSDGPVEFRLGGRTISTGETTPPPRIFDPGFFVGALPGGGVAFSDSTAYRIKVTAPAGGIVRVFPPSFRLCFSRSTSSG